MISYHDSANTAGAGAGAGASVPFAGAATSIDSIYVRSALTRKISLHVTEVGKHTQANLEAALVSEIGNRCIVEGFVQASSIRLMTYSAGLVSAGDYVDFHVVYECKVAYPVEGMPVEAQAKTITKAGIHAEVVDADGNVPITVFIARDHHTSEPHFHEVKVGESVQARIVGIRFELNDPYICVIATLMRTTTR